MTPREFAVEILTDLARNRPDLVRQLTDGKLSPRTVARGLSRSLREEIAGEDPAAIGPIPLLVSMLESGECDDLIAGMLGYV